MENINSENTIPENADSENTDQLERGVLTALQGVVGMTIIEVMKSREKYLEIVLPKDEEVANRPLTETVLIILTRLKVIEAQILAAIVEVTGDDENPEENPKLPGGMLNFLRQYSHDATLGLMLLNEFITPEELRSIYNSNETEPALRVYETREGNTEKKNVLDAASGLQEFVTKHRENRGAIPQGST